MRPTIIIPMAVEGSRFAQVGYKTIKPLIPILGKPMVQHVVESVGIKDANWVFIVQKKHRDELNLDEVLTQIQPNCIIVDTGGGVTEGAACSILLAENHIDLKEPLIIINSDNIIHWEKDELTRLEKESLDGLILCFRDSNPKWSFVRLNSNGHVLEVAEKKPISDIATAGMYVWKTGESFIRAAKSMVAKNIRVNGEFYLCPVYNENIKMNEKIGISWVKEMHGVGTPEDLQKYLRLKNET